MFRESLIEDRWRRVLKKKIVTKEFEIVMVCFDYIEFFMSVNINRLKSDFIQKLCYVLHKRKVP